jgi:predicted ferric reductase
MARRVHLCGLWIDPFLRFDLWDGFVPLTADYRPWQVGLGVLSLWITTLVLVSTWAAGRIPRRWWRIVHYASYVAYGLALLHALYAGSDTEHWPTHILYSATAGTLAGALFVRFFVRDWARETFEHHAPG